MSRRKSIPDGRMPISGHLSSTKRASACPGWKVTTWVVSAFLLVRVVHADPTVVCQGHAMGGGGPTAFSYDVHSSGPPILELSLIHI